MKMALAIVIILITSVLYGCTDEEIAKEMFGEVPLIGWITGAALDDWEKDQPNRISNANPDQKNSTTAQKYTDKLPEMPDINANCPPHQYWNAYYYTCMCEADYYLDINTQECIPKSTRECTVDRDCSPNGQLSKCINEYTKAAYYCDLNSYTCKGGKSHGVEVNCMEEYGPKYVCRNGNCVTK